MYRIFKKVAFLTVFLAFLSSASAANAIKTIVNDTIAGYPTALKTSITTPNQKISFRVQKPNGSIVEIFAETNDLGVAKNDLLGFHTKLAGTYQVSAANFGENHDNVLVSTFKVFPDEISTDQSRVIIDPGAIAADGLEQSTIKISLRDTYSNPIQNRNVIIVSSRATDEIEKISEKASDQNGNIFFQVSSSDTGISHFTVIDRNTGAILNDREKLVFFEPDYSTSDFGGNYLQTNLFGDFEGGSASLFEDDVIDDGDLFGPIDHFDIDYPSKVEVGSDQGFLKISAKDREGRVVKNYTGTIRIAIPNDENAILPSNGEYNFQEKDQGERTFDLALVFSKIGKQTIQVFDFDSDAGTASEFIKGEKIIEVISPNPNPQPVPSDDIEIKKPQDGAKFGGSILTVVGKARPNTNLKLFLDEVKIADIEVDSGGQFIKDIQNIEDGDHELFVREAEGGQESSKTVNFFVDSLPPTLDEIEIYPTGPVYVGDPFTITVRSDPSLQNVSFRVSSINEVLLEDKTEKGKYEMTIAATMSPGEYTISVTLADDLQNKGEFSNAAILRVIPKIAEKNLPVPENLIAETFDSSIKLSWDNIEKPADATKIRIFYGTSKFNLAKSADVEISQNQVIISELINDTDYFFSAISIDDANNQSNQGAIISAMPKKTDDPTPPPPIIIHPAANELSATSGNEKVFLRWTKPAEIIDHFEIGIGIDRNNFFETIEVTGSSSSIDIKDLINGQKYYFKLTPKNADNSSTREEFPIASATPNWNGSHPEPNPPIEIVKHEREDLDDTGPIHEKIIFSSTLFALAIFFIRRSLLIFRN